MSPHTEYKVIMPPRTEYKVIMPPHTEYKQGNNTHDIGEVGVPLVRFSPIHQEWTKETYLITCKHLYYLNVIIFSLCMELIASTPCAAPHHQLAVGCKTHHWCITSSAADCLMMQERHWCITSSSAGCWMQDTSLMHHLISSRLFNDARHTTDASPHQQQTV